MHFPRYLTVSEYMKEPSDLAVSNFGGPRNRDIYYVCDFKGHEVIVIDDGGNFLKKIGGPNYTNFPNGEYGYSMHKKWRQRESSLLKIKFSYAGH